jgi:hypothetical protein
MVTSEFADAAAPVDATPAPDAAPSPSCEAVRAACGPAPQQFVRGHAEGLTGLDGARAQFAIRYLRESGNGLDVPHGVASAWGRVTGGAFEACVCLPRGGDEYPQVAAVVFAPGTSGELRRDVARAMYSPRYATLGDEELTQALREAPTDEGAEAALAAMVDRVARLSVQGFDAAAEGARVYGGLVADERPVAAQVAGAAVAAGGAQLNWIMPGRAWPGERLALLVDRNGDRRCDDGDLGAIVPVDGRPSVTVRAWLQGAALTSVCASLRLEASREP